MSRIHTVVVQESLRFDSIAALYLLQVMGRGKYPGVDKAQIKFWGTGTIPPDTQTWRDYLERGVLLLGVGGGPLDEHQSAEFGDRKAEGLSTTLLVARDLGIEKSPVFKRLVQVVTSNDLIPVPDPLSMAAMVKQMHRRGWNPLDVIDWVFKALDVWVATQREFLEAQRDFRQAQFETVVNPNNGRELRIAFIVSDNAQMNAAARFRDRDLAVLIQRRRSGRTQIFSNQKLGVELHKVAAAIRRAELETSGLTCLLGPESLEAPGQLPDVPDWCFQMPGQNLLNGSETAPGLQPTLLDAKTIRQIVLENIVFAPIEQDASAS